MSEENMLGEPVLGEPVIDEPVLCEAALDEVERAIQDIADGRPVVVVDDAVREN